jgi:hypothetical protein
MSCPLKNNNIIFSTVEEITENIQDPGSITRRYMTYLAENDKPAVLGAVVLSNLR